MYYLCNFMEKEIKGYNKKGLGFVRITDNLNSSVQEADCYKIEENGVIGLQFTAVKETCNGEKIDFLGNFTAMGNEENTNDLISSYSNPIIIVATKKFKIYDGIPTYIKYIPVKDGVLVALIKGFISVEGVDGEMIPLSRNCDAITSDSGTVYGAEEVKKLNILKDKDSDIFFSDYVVSDCVLNIKICKDGSKLSSLKFNKDNFVILNEKVFEEAKEKKRLELAAKEEEKRRKDEEVSKFMEDYRKKSIDEEVQKVLKESKKKSPKKKKEVVEVVTGSLGAQSFLASLGMLGNE